MDVESPISFDLVRIVVVNWDSWSCPQNLLRWGLRPRHQVGHFGGEAAPVRGIKSRARQTPVRHAFAYHSPRHIGALGVITDH